MRKKLLIKPLFQLRHLVWTLAVIVVCFVSGYMMFESIVRNAVMQAPIGAEQWLGLRETLRLGFLVAFVILICAIGIETYFFTHSIAGPLYALEKGLRRLAQGDFTDVVRIRETDQFSELIREFEEVKHRLLHRHQSQQSAVEELTRELDRLLTGASLNNLESIRTKLKEIRAQVERKAA
jgi:nitrate/nitrite-specific signal transduction histidine kinase